ncbi:hypothetical protein BV898_18061 [Hypsibius exemplaris]|uniref:Uncharacterized protein n=1 Tax=Hypsibius exemplaris TaxID=2072580 RepID=A0A9X6NG60_HYPEX|nr:hypothetical protein BV898_18061 [Hypsibius exemplaris]
MFQRGCIPICIAPTWTRDDHACYAIGWGTTVDRSSLPSGEDCRINDCRSTIHVRCPPATGRSQAVRFRSMQGGTGVGAGARAHGGG